MQSFGRIRNAARYAALLLAIILLFSACTHGSNGSKTTPEPVVSPAPEVEYSMTHLIRYWPEDADYDSCDYSCVIEAPQFSLEYTCGSAMNRAVTAYIERLQQRIEEQYMLSPVADHPHTEVTCAVERVNGCTNIVFSEEHSYEAQPIRETYVLMLDEYGSEINLCDVFLNYHAEDVIAERIAELTEKGSGYYPSDKAKVFTAIDIKNGAKATETGCTVYVKEGLLAPFEEGELEFDLAFADIYPDYVGEGKVFSYEEYALAVELLAYTADAAIVREENITGGELSEYEATSFMGEAVKRMGIAPDAGRLTVTGAQFESFYTSCFGTVFPGIDTSAHDIRLEDGNYSVSSAAKEYRYNVDMLSVSQSGDTVIIDGDVVFGTFGYAFTAYVCHVTVTLIRSENSPFAFMLSDYIMSL